MRERGSEGKKWEKGREKAIIVKAPATSQHLEWTGAGKILEGTKILTKSLTVTRAEKPEARGRGKKCLDPPLEKRKLNPWNPPWLPENLKRNPKC